MLYYYQAYNIPIISTIELPSLMVYEGDFVNTEPIRVELGNVPKKLQNLPNEQKSFCSFNENEWLYTFPNIASYYVKNGQYIIVEPISDNRHEILIYLFNNGLSAALFQRNLFPFHLSGIFVGADKVVLFAAPSRTGKSTLAVEMQELGYDPFTDDSAILNVEDGIAYATASYPMAKLWQESFEQQKLYVESDKQPISPYLNKYIFLFHERFVNTKIEIVGIVFLETEGSEIKTARISPTRCMQLLGQNIYRREWVIGMKKQLLQFEILSSLSQKLIAYIATRPKNIPTFGAFAKTIQEQIINQL